MWRQPNLSKTKSYSPEMCKFVQGYPWGKTHKHMPLKQTCQGCACVCHVLLPESPASHTDRNKRQSLFPLDCQMFAFCFPFLALSLYPDGYIIVMVMVMMLTRFWWWCWWPFAIIRSSVCLPGPGSSLPLLEQEVKMTKAIRFAFRWGMMDWQWLKTQII